MVRGLEQVRVLRLMAGGANLDLSRRQLYRIRRQVQRVAARAGDVAGCMRARCESVGGIRLVAGEALRILLDGRCGCLRTKINHARQWAAARFYVRAAREERSVKQTVDVRGAG